MWHDQGKWVTCRQCSILSFQYNLLVHLKSYMLIQTPLKSEIWFQRSEQIFEFLNNVKHRNLSPLVAYNSKSILATSDSFPLIVSHMCWNPNFKRCIKLVKVYRVLILVFQDHFNTSVFSMANYFKIVTWYLLYELQQQEITVISHWITTDKCIIFPRFVINAQLQASKRLMSIRRHFDQWYLDHDDFRVYKLQLPLASQSNTICFPPNKKQPHTFLKATPCSLQHYSAPQQAPTESPKPALLRQGDLNLISG